MAIDSIIVDNGVGWGLLYLPSMIVKHRKYKTNRTQYSILAYVLLELWFNTCINKVLSSHTCDTAASGSVGPII